MTTCKVWNWVGFSKSLLFITLEFPSHWHLGRALLPTGLESGLHCCFAHPELKLLGVGLTGPVAPTYAWISASARITVYPSEVSACITSFWNSLWNLVLDSFCSQSTFCFLCCSMQLVGLRGVFHTIILWKKGLSFVSQSSAASTHQTFSWELSREHYLRLMWISVWEVSRYGMDTASYQSLMPFIHSSCIYLSMIVSDTKILLSRCWPFRGFTRHGCLSLLPPNLTIPQFEFTSVHCKHSHSL